MMRKIVSGFLDDIVRPINPSAIVLLGLFTILWGLWIIVPFWDVFTTASVFSALAGFAPEWAWGLNAIVCGSLTVYGVFSRKYSALATGTAIASWHWFIISLFCFVGSWTNTAGIVYLFLATTAMLSRLNMKLSYKTNHSVDKMFVK